ncbi:hypothetical protein, partial [Bradyrhizobium uaiense]
TFKAGLMVGGNEEVAGDVSFHVDLADNAEQALIEAENLRKRSRDVLRRPMNRPDELEQAHNLRHGLRQGMLNLLRNGDDLGT